MIYLIFRTHAAIYDSYNCGMVWKFGHTRPWPTKRKGFYYVGYGPSKNYAMKALRRKRCPVKCRPEAHKDWQYCWKIYYDWRKLLQTLVILISQTFSWWSEWYLSSITFSSCDKSSKYFLVKIELVFLQSWQSDASLKLPVYWTSWNSLIQSL